MYLNQACHICITINFYSVLYIVREVNAGSICPVFHYDVKLCRRCFVWSRNTNNYP